MNNHAHIGEDDPEFVEVDPTGRYGRYKEILGKGASKIVYRAFDEYQGIEVAWNQVKLNDFLQSSGDLEMLYCEIHLLKMLKHKNIMKYYTSWIDSANRNINFVTEMLTSGTLKQYREKHRRVSIVAIKSWCRQILKGLLYLHSLDPPVIHRDLKCDNIFVNGNQGEVKIGDLGLAAILRKSHAAHCVGTPEFMAPEVYAEEYNELVDIYSFGMCILEMVTLEYPYNECTHPAQIYKKVTSGKKPDALYKVKDPEVRHFVEKCLATVSLRLSARELLDDSFLQIDSNSDLRLFGSWREEDQRNSPMRQPLIGLVHEGNSYGNVSFNEYSKGLNFESHGEWEFDSMETGKSGIELFEDANHELEEHLTTVGITIKGKRKDGIIFLRLQILDNEECLRSIYFPFNIEIDTAMTVATEMVAELDIDDQDVTKIADMIDGEIASLVPEWKAGPGFEETPRFPKPSYFHNCASENCSTSPFLNLSTTSAPQNMKMLPCSGIGCAAMHGRFEEITYQIDSPRKNASKSVNSPLLLHQVKGFNGTGIWDCQKSPESSAMGLDEESELDRTSSRKGKKEKNARKGNASYMRSYMKAFADLCHIKAASCFSNGFSEKLESEFQQEMRWISAKYHEEMRGFADPKLRLVPGSPGTMEVINGVSPDSILHPFQGEIISKLFSKYRSGSRWARKLGPFHEYNGEGVAATAKSSHRAIGSKCPSSRINI